ncbi:MAG: TatD family hydrolase [bacterium]
MLVDSHVNLHGEPYAEDLEKVLERADQANVKAMLTISDRLSSIPSLEFLSSKYNHIWHSVGVHPHHADDYKNLESFQLIEFSRHPRAIGIGECGMDFHYEYSDRLVQERVFRAHIDASRETELPLIIHTRNADEVTLKLLTREYAKGAFPILLHCYTSGQALCDAALEMGAYVAFAGIITFKKADEVRQVARSVPLDRLLIETDCPYLAPVPYRGRRNEPAYVAEVAEKLAEIKQVSTDDIAQITTDNFFRLFTKANRESIAL